MGLVGRRRAWNHVDRVGYHSGTAASDVSRSPTHLRCPRNHTPHPRGVAISSLLLGEVNSPEVPPIREGPLPPSGDPNISDEMGLRIVAAEPGEACFPLVDENLPAITPRPSTRRRASSTPNRTSCSSGVVFTPSWRTVRTSSQVATEHERGTEMSGRSPRVSTTPQSWSRRPSSTGSCTTGICWWCERLRPTRSPPLRQSATPRTRHQNAPRSANKPP